MIKSWRVVVRVAIAEDSPSHETLRFEVQESGIRYRY